MPRFRRKQKKATELLNQISAGRGEGLTLCVFCADVINEPPLLLDATWMGDEEERGQWFWSHRECFRQPIADDESVRGGPLFES